MRGPDVLIAGAGPAGSIAAIVLARGGARVLMVDREVFPREKLCGDTLNPGALALLDGLQLTREWDADAVVLRGMHVTGPGVIVEARYGPHTIGRSIRRRIFDEWLLQAAIAAGAECELGVSVRAAHISSSAGEIRCGGLDVQGPTGTRATLRAPVTIAADGRRSPTAISAALLTHPAEPRRWAFGTYATGIADVGDFGEMHTRPGHYIGVAPVRGGEANVCVVTRDRALAATPLRLIRETLARDPRLRDRVARARFDAPVHVLGPLAVDVPVPGMTGLLLAGDAAGFVDPMTGDGLCLAMRGGLLAAEVALAALASGDSSAAVADLRARRRRFLEPKLRFNRMLRALVDWPMGMRMAGYGAAWVPGALRYLVLRAGDAA